jgi:hypothetical protein
MEPAPITTITFVISILTRDGCSLSAHKVRQLSGISFALDLDCRYGVVDGLEIIRSKLYARAAEILFETKKLGRPGDRHDPWFLRKEPGERNLRLGCLFLLGDAAKLIDQGLIRFASIGGETRNDVTKIVLVELSLLRDSAGEKALAQRAEWDESDAEFFESGKDFLLRFAPP